LPENGWEGRADNMDKKKQQYKCAVCGYIYDPENGDRIGGIPAGTAFEDLPDDWACPLCSSDKSEFKPTISRPMYQPPK